VKSGGYLRKIWDAPEREKGASQESLSWPARPVMPAVRPRSQVEAEFILLYQLYAEMKRMKERAAWLTAEALRQKESPC